MEITTSHQTGKENNRGYIIKIVAIVAIALILIGLIGFFVMAGGSTMIITTNPTPPPTPTTTILPTPTPSPCPTPHEPDPDASPETNNTTNITPLPVNVTVKPKPTPTPSPCPTPYVNPYQLSLSVNGSDIAVINEPYTAELVITNNGPAFTNHKFIFEARGYFQLRTTSEWVYIDNFTLPASLSLGPGASLSFDHTWTIPDMATDANGQQILVHQGRWKIDVIVRDATTMLPITSTEYMATVVTRDQDGLININYKA